VSIPRKVFRTEFERVVADRDALVKALDDIIGAYDYCSEDPADRGYAPASDSRVLWDCNPRRLPTMAEHTPTPWRVETNCWTPWNGAVGILPLNDDEDSAIAWTTAGTNEAANAAFIVKAVNNHDALVKALEDLVNAKALSGVRAIVAGWNGEGRAEPYNERHPSKLGATLPKTNCGAVYELDEAMQRARALVGQLSNPSPPVDGRGK
jgi:hypothetical protein